MKLKNIVFFDDISSFLHTAIAALSVILNIGIEATLAYTAYQVLDGDDREHMLGDLAEWIAGLLIGAIIKATI